MTSATYSLIFLLLVFRLSLPISQQPIAPNCVILIISNLSAVEDCLWSEQIITCLKLSPLSFNLGGGSHSFDLQNITCAQYTLRENSPCSCQMDCLLSFNGRRLGMAYAIFGAISCDTSQLGGVKAFFTKPDIAVTLIGEPVPFASCSVKGQVSLDHCLCSSITRLCLQMIVHHQ